MEHDTTMRILAVDDEPVFLDILEQHMVALGFTDVVYCESAEDALSTLDGAGQGFDCFLVDIKMPGMDGIELCKRIRRRPDCQATPILMLTAMSESNYVDAAFLAGASDYITKPINKMELSARLRSAGELGRERSRVAALTSTLKGQTFGQSALTYSDPVRLHDLEGAVDYVALKNYALTLGNLRMLNWQAVGFHLTGASEFLAATGPAEYIEMMQDVGSILFDILKLGRVMIAHAGSGNFVALIGRERAYDPDETQSSVNALLVPFNDYYRTVCPVQIGVIAGHAKRSALLSFQPADRSIEQALSSALTRAANAALTV
ncbi:response regulator [Rhodobacteraceae bacterium W635]|uniref:response regulator n=1 Tax=Nioella halotolerans TaxID=2303578 RepID=UPI000E3CB61A|nr:response regulator [Rhodobacteraceae bacterium W635]